jgi:DNA-binding NtrC family response regulator
LQVPPLRERKEDIPLLAQLFAKTYSAKHGTRSVKLPAKTLEYLCEYPWTGNVRELKNAMEAGIVLCHGNVLKPEDMHLSGLPSIDDAHEPDSQDSFSLEDTERNAIIRALKQTNGVQKEAAKLLGISRRAIHYKIKKYDIDSNGLRSRHP